MRWAIFVAPLAGARIEIFGAMHSCAGTIVAPLAGARIEIVSGICRAVAVCVAPLAGARIEILRLSLLSLSISSLPSRERGLKFRHGYSP